MSWGSGPVGNMSQLIPGTYIDIAVTSQTNFAITDRGYLAVATELPWGTDGQVMTVTADDYILNCKEIFGYAIGSPEIAFIDELFKGGAQTLYIYRTNSGQKAKNKYATAVNSGELGNKIKIVIEENEGYVEPPKVEGGCGEDCDCNTDCGCDMDECTEDDIDDMFVTATITGEDIETGFTVTYQNLETNTGKVVVYLTSGGDEDVTENAEVSGSGEVFTVTKGELVEGSYRIDAILEDNPKVLASKTFEIEE